MHTTRGLAIVWLDVVISAVSLCGTSVPSFELLFCICLNFYLLVINLASVTGRRFPNSKPSPSPVRYRQSKCDTKTTNSTVKIHIFNE